jgi:hypothetical protein
MDPKMKIKISRDGIEIGEEELQDIEKKLKAGVIKTTDHYWHDGMIQWEPVTKLLEKIDRIKREAKIAKEQKEAEQKSSGPNSNDSKTSQDWIFEIGHTLIIGITYICYFLFISFLYIYGFIRFVSGETGDPTGSAIRQAVLEQKTTSGLLIMILATLLVILQQLMVMRQSAEKKINK